MGGLVLRQYTKSRSISTPINVWLFSESDMVRSSTEEEVPNRAGLGCYNNKTYIHNKSACMHAQCIRPLSFVKCLMWLIHEI